MTTRADSVRVAHPLFQTESGGSIPTSALQLRFYECDVKTAQELNKAWHSRLPKTSWSNLIRTCHLACYTAMCDGLYYATAIWTQPIARYCPQNEWLELRRMAISGDAPRNTASRMLAWMAKDIRKRWPEVSRLISYQDTDGHKGTIYSAAGWVAGDVGQRIKKGWDSRDRNAMQSKAPKIRWEKEL